MIAISRSISRLGILLVLLLIIVGANLQLVLLTLSRTEKVLSETIANKKEPLEALSACGKICQYAPELLADYNTSAQVILGVQYQYGLISGRNLKEAIKRYKSAASRNDAIAQLLLGILSDPYNDLTADLQSDYSSGKNYLIGPNHERLLVVSDQDAESWYSKSAEQGNVAAQLLLGELYQKNERKDPNNIIRAAQWYHIASSAGNREAQYHLGELYTIGYGVEQDNGKGIELLKKSAEQGHIEAAFSLGIEYEKSYPEEAVKWYKKAADFGNQFAQRNLGLMYAKGVGVPRDYVEAYIWLNLAAAKSAPNASIARDGLEVLMTPVQLSEAQRQVSNRLSQK